MTYHDISRAAAEALELAVPSDEAKTYEQRKAEIRKIHPRAYEKWTDREDARLTELHGAGKKASEIAATLQRQPSAIRSRIAKLDLEDQSED